MSTAFALALLKFFSWLQSSETHPSICSCFVALSLPIRPFYSVPPLIPPSLKQHRNKTSLAGRTSSWAKSASNGLPYRNSTSVLRIHSSISRPGRLLLSNSCWSSPTLCGPAIMVSITTTQSQQPTFLKQRPSATRFMHSLPWDSKTSSSVTMSS